ncbi:MAG: hypothetical protein M1822_009080 [Bathelium mastoideum]|nr:MAG: hypothetical protein M1822_009080 [Bathelium mastoideum]
MTDCEQMADYIVVGGGLTGCVVASRLSESSASVSVILLEAGIDASDNPHVSTPEGAFLLAGTNVDWAYKTVADPNTRDRVHTVPAGKALGGGSICNYGGWSRGDAADYNDWAKAVGDERWSYEKQLPYFRKSENFFDPNADPKQHGFAGPLHITSITADAKRKYGLREPLKQV